VLPSRKSRPQVFYHFSKLTGWLIHNELDLPPPGRNVGLHEAPRLEDEELNTTPEIVCNRTIIGFARSLVSQ
jgi:hypothetical protein